MIRWDRPGLILTKNNPTQNFQCVDLARTLAILMVMAGHLKPTLPLPPPAFRWGWDHFQRTQIDGVLIFFVVSGFLITRIIDLGPGGILRPSWKYFYVRRVARLLPLFLFQVFLGLFLIYFFSDGSKKFNYCFKLPDPGTRLIFWGSLFSFSFNWGSALFSKSWHGIGDHWSIFWSLAVEEQFYLFYPLVLGLLGNLRNMVSFLFLVVILSFSGVLFLESVGISVPAQAGVYIFSYGHIAVGALLYLLVRRCETFQLSHQIFSFLITVTGFILLLPVFLCDWTFTSFLIAPSIFMILFGGIRLLIFQSDFLKLFAAPGRYSYGNYLFHIVVLFFIHQYLWNLNIVLAFMVFVIFSTFVCSLSFRFFETPANQWIRKTFSAEN
jgi:peptidoglycan/LPS O-acetylase OafA/YrhL